MNSYLKEFLKRGMMFGGFGPIVLGVVFLVLSRTVDSFSLTAKDYFIGTVSVYLLAFVQAGASVFNQIEQWPLSKAMLCHFSVLYVSYSICYVLNSWIPFEPKVLLIFTAIFIIVYLITWLTVFLIVKSTSKKLNGKLS